MCPVWFSVSIGLKIYFQDSRSEAANLEKHPRRSEAVTKDEIFVTFTSFDLEIRFALKMLSKSPHANAFKKKIGKTVNK